jgi:ATP/maltotriose-dependent transcriptional regulator MalT
MPHVSVERGRDAFARQAWGEAHTHLSESAADAEDLERLAIASYLLGRDDDAARAWERAHRACVESADPDSAGRCAFWLALTALLRGEEAHAGGWLARAERVLQAAGEHCAARALLLVPRYVERLNSGDPTTADTLAAEMVDLGHRCRDNDVLAFGLLGRGEAAIARGERIQGIQFLDEVMVSITTGEVSPIARGIVYCAVIEACVEVFDLRRAAEWTDALTQWCDAQPDLVPFRGQCLVHRSQVLQAHGAWTEAVAEAERARARLSEPAHPAVGLAYYQQAELHRLRGEFDAAEHAYRAASQQGREPAPGLSLLRLATGNVDAAVAAIQRMVEESRGTPSHLTMLAAAVDILLAARDVPAARAVQEELSQLVDASSVPLLDAIAAYAAGSVLLAEGDMQHALAALRRACTNWQELAMPYDAARARVQIALACQALGDRDAAELALEAARAEFERLGARPDLERVARLTGASPGVLTDRECEVLRLVARGLTNREIAADLVISEHTVARHLQNVFAKVGLSSRAAATAYAYEHGIV